MPSPEISEDGMIALETVIGDPCGRNQEGSPSPLRGFGIWGDCLPRAEARGYMPVPLRGTSAVQGTSEVQEDDI